jgi:hypothetical protein
LINFRNLKKGSALPASCSATITTPRGLPIAHFVNSGNIPFLILYPYFSVFKANAAIQRARFFAIR